LKEEIHYSCLELAIPVQRFGHLVFSGVAPVHETYSIIQISRDSLKKLAFVVPNMLCIYIF